MNPNSIIKSDRIDKLFTECRNQNIAIIGDLMVDRYFWGEIERISPEAPVPVVQVYKESYSFGGASNVANNLASLGASATPFGIMGDDQIGRTFIEDLKRNNIKTDCIYIDSSRPTTVKTRVIARNQHVVRVDQESKDDISSEIEKKLIGAFSEQAGSFSGVIFQDYNKGVITKKIIREVIKIARKNNLFIAVDPKFRYFFEYKNVSLFKPNIKETEAAFGTKIQDEDDLIACGKEIFKRSSPDSVLITRGSSGLTLFENPDEPPAHLSTIARKVHDVSGAGDTVIAALTAFYTAGATLREASVIANYAAGTVCEEVGVVPVNKEKLRQILIGKSV